jgi:hypothetical protein
MNSSAKRGAGESWKTHLKRLRQEAEGEKWLQTLYTAYLQRFLSDNNRIWVTGQLLVPLSVAPLAVVATLKSPPVVSVLLLAACSVPLVWFWIVIAESHRSFQEIAHEWLSAIEETLEVDRRVAIKEGFTVRRIRLALASLITLIWIGLLVFVLFCSPVADGGAL